MDQLRLAICSETFPAETWTVDRAAQFAARCGYTGWEVAPFMLDGSSTSDPLAWREMSLERRTAYRATVERAGLQIIGLHWLLAKTTGIHLTTADRAVRLRTADLLIDLAQLCAELGGQVLVFGSPMQRSLEPGTSSAEAYDRAAEVLAQVAPTLERLQVTLALEPLGPAETDFMNTADEARMLADMVGSSQIALHLDVKAMSTESIPMPELIRTNAGWLTHFHANDPNRRGPGMGDTPVEPYLGALRDSSYQGWVSVEVFDPTPGAECLAQESAENLRAAWAKLST